MSLLIAVCQQTTNQIIEHRGRFLNDTDNTTVNAFYYEDPADGCRSDEKHITIDGFPRGSCAPKMDKSNHCPTSPIPPGNFTAEPMPTVKDESGQFYCLLVCSGLHIGSCPAHSGCVENGLFGVCFYDLSS